MLQLQLLCHLTTKRRSAKEFQNLSREFRWDEKEKFPKEPLAVRHWNQSSSTAQHFPVCYRCSSTTLSGTIVCCLYQIYIHSNQFSCHVDERTKRGENLQFETKRNKALKAIAREPASLRIHFFHSIWRHSPLGKAREISRCSALHIASHWLAGKADFIFRILMTGLSLRDRS